MSPREQLARKFRQTLIESVRDLVERVRDTDDDALKSARTVVSLALARAEANTTDLGPPLRPLTASPVENHTLHESIMKLARHANKLDAAARAAAATATATAPPPTPIPNPPTPIPNPPTPIPPPEPWPFIARARAFFERYLTEPPAAIDTLIFWCLHAWAHAETAVSPRLILHGLDPRADHARALRLLSWFVPNPRLIARTTSYSVLDLLANERPTLLFDDTANAILARRDLRALIAAGAHRDGAFLGRRAPGKTTPFRPCAAPLAIATALPPPPSILAHAIVLPMAPAVLAGQGGPPRLALAEPPDEAKELRAGFEALASHRAPTNHPPATLPVFLSAAARETWAPLFAFAQAIGPDAEAAMRAASSQFASPDHLEPPTSALALLRDIRLTIGIDEQPVPSKHLVEELTRNPDGPWISSERGAPLTPRGIAQRLAKFGLKPQVIHMEEAPSFRGYKAEPLHLAFARYLDDPVARGVLLSEEGAR
ncbi:MAG: DUF3631 domain-containing protein [Alphaproteobacteria bacterium]|nr:DUF3631 domain-containing protein [Alphaproteobacteria bacterium]